MKNKALEQGQAAWEMEVGTINIKPTAGAICAISSIARKQYKFNPFLFFLLMKVRGITFKINSLNNQFDSRDKVESQTKTQMKA